MASLTLSEKLDQLGNRYEEMTQQLSTAEAVSDSARFQKLAKQHSELAEIVNKHREFKQIEKDLAGAHQMVLENEDPEMKQMAHDEEKQLLERKEIVERELKLLLLPKDPNDDKNVIVEIRAGTVAVLPEADDIDIKIEAKDLRIDTFCSSGPGGQSVNTTYSAVRITHLPSGLVVSLHDEKSQIKTRAKAMRVLRARLYEQEQEKQQAAIVAERRGQIKTGDRSEKIRTYNFPQNRVTDHRIGLTLHQLTDVMDGKLGPLVDGLVAHYESERLQQELATA